MSTPAEEIWAILREVSQAQKQFREDMAESKRQSEEAKRQSEENERKYQQAREEAKRQSEEAERKAQERREEAERKYQEMREEAERKYQQAREEAKRQSEEAERQARARSEEAERQARERSEEADRKYREMCEENERKYQQMRQERARSSRELDKKLNKLEALFTSQWGKLMESLVDGDLVPILTRWGIPIQDTSTRVRGKLPDGYHYEFDIIAHNGEAIVVVEVKTTLRSEDVTDFINKLKQVKIWMPRYQQNIIYGAMAWLSADPSVESLLSKQGLFSIRATGKSAAIVNSADFQPQTW